MNYLIETSIIVKRNKRSGQAYKWKTSKRIVAADSIEAARLLDDQANLVEHGTSDFGCRSVQEASQ